MTTNLYVTQLSEDLQLRIYEALHEELSADLSGEELESAILDGMDSRLSDLSDTINIAEVLGERSF